MCTVLPRFVVLNMIRDFVEAEEEAAQEAQSESSNKLQYDHQLRRHSQFHKIYLHHYENVSILFADAFDYQSRWSPDTAQPNAPNDCWSDLLTYWNKSTLVEYLLANKGSNRGWPRTVVCAFSMRTE